MIRIEHTPNVGFEIFAMSVMIFAFVVLIARLTYMGVLLPRRCEHCGKRDRRWRKIPSWHDEYFLKHACGGYAE